MSLVVEYRRSWTDDYCKIRDYVLSGVTTYRSIEHFGSTSIPGMVAKPIIDIMMVIPKGRR